MTNVVGQYKQSIAVLNNDSLEAVAQMIERNLELQGFSWVFESLPHMNAYCWRVTNRARTRRGYLPGFYLQPVKDGIMAEGPWALFLFEREMDADEQLYWKRGIQAMLVDTCMTESTLPTVEAS